MIIRPARLDDLTALLRIGTDFYEVNPVRDTCRLNYRSLADTLVLLLKEHVLLVLADEREVVGVAGAFIAPLYWNFGYKQALEFFWWIDHPYRKDGNGMKLYQALEDAVRARDVKYMHMVALAESDEELVGKLYERNGNRKVETLYMKVLS